MPLDSQEVSEEVQEESLGSLGGCLVEGDPEQRSRERRVRRRALAISVLIQTGVLALLVLLPFFGKTERIALAKNYIPIPPYGHPHHPAGPTKSRQAHPFNPGDHITFLSPTAKSIPPSNAGESADGPPDITGENEGESGPECSWCINIGSPNSGPRPPQPVVETSSKPRVMHEPTIDPAMLIRRIEPVYPPLAIQIHKEGRVEMRARIATDGTIQSLEIVSGDPIFYQSAKEAVSQWLYRPTILNGQKVEIDTYITVIYTMSH
jgi:periplasmic protein TonB